MTNINNRTPCPPDIDVRNHWSKRTFTCPTCSDQGQASSGWSEGSGSRHPWSRCWRRPPARPPVGCNFERGLGESSGTQYRRDGEGIQRTKEMQDGWEGSIKWSVQRQCSVWNMPDIIIFCCLLQRSTTADCHRSCPYPLTDTYISTEHISKLNFWAG